MREAMFLSEARFVGLGETVAGPWGAPVGTRLREDPFMDLCNCTPSAYVSGGVYASQSVYCSES